MTLFIDTSALYAALDHSDRGYREATKAWNALAASGETAITSNYVLVESVALLQRRLGLQAVRDFQTQFVPVLEVHWVDAMLHDTAAAIMLTAGQKNLSLVDCVSFETMRHLGLDTAFTFDAHFVQQGFRSIP